MLRRTGLPLRVLVVVLIWGPLGMSDFLSCGTQCNAEYCLDMHKRFVYCVGFCCPAIGCCSFSSLWYAWLLLGLLALLCLCACIGCGARRYHLAAQRIRQERRRRPFEERTTPQADTQFNNQMHYHTLKNDEAPPPYCLTDPTAPPPPYRQ